MHQGLNEMSCSICLERFRNPKLLPCLNTFCRKCLENHIKDKIVNEQPNKLTCPLCRHSVCIPSSGINGLFPNYFVPDRRCDPGNICEVCNESVMNTFCRFCDEFLCLDCKGYHRCEFKCTTTELVLSDSESDDDDEADLRLAVRIIFSGSNLHATKKQANIVNKFSVSNDSNSSAAISCILPLHQGGALVVLDQCPDALQIDQHGNRTDSIHVGYGIRDKAYGQNDRIFLLQFSTSSILELCGRQVQTFTSLSYIDPIDLLAMSFFPDGRSAVVAKDENAGMIIVLQSDGNVLRHICRLSFLGLSGVAVIPNLNVICLLDSCMDCLIFTLSDGQHIGHWIRNPLDLMDNTEDLNFAPSVLCCDGEDNVIVYDRVSGLLYLINSVGQLNALMNTKSPLGLGSPGAIRVAPDGDLWIGDSATSTIRILKTSRYKNSLLLSGFLFPR